MPRNNRENFSEPQRTLEVDEGPGLEGFVERLLISDLNLLRETLHTRKVIGVFGFIRREVQRSQELNPPFGRKRQKTQWQGKSNPFGPGPDPNPRQIDMSLLGAQHETRDNRTSRPHGKSDKAGSKALQAVGFRARLETPLFSLREKKEQLIPLEYFKRVGVRSLNTSKPSRDRSQKRRMFEVLPISEDPWNTTTGAHDLIRDQHRIKSRATRMIGRNDRTALEVAQVFFARHFHPEPTAHGLHREPGKETGQQARSLVLRRTRTRRLAQRQNLGCTLLAHEFPIEFFPGLPAFHEFPILPRFIPTLGLESKFTDRYFPKNGLRDLHCFLPIAMQAFSNANGTSRNQTTGPGSVPIRRKE